MRLRTHLRSIRLARGLSIGDVAHFTGLSKGEVSMFERGHSIPRDDQAAAMLRVYGPRDAWYPATVARALLADLAECPGCGDELDPDASGARKYHPECANRRKRAAASV